MMENNSIATLELSIDFTPYLNVPGIIICTFGAISNVLLLVAFIKDPLKCLRNSRTYISCNEPFSLRLSNMSILDLFVFSSTPMTALHPIPNFFFNWIGCWIDRFLIVVYPMKYRILIKGKVMFIWIAAISTVSSVIPIYLYCCLMIMARAPELDRLCMFLV